jgi:hypothetical protein
MRPLSRTARLLAATLGLVAWLAAVPAASSQELVVARIHDLQGAAHLSPFSGQDVSGVEGIVTVERSTSFWMQTRPRTPTRPPPTAFWCSARAWGRWSTSAITCG